MAATCGLALATGCIAQTTYLPKDKRRATFVMQTNRMHVYAGGAVRDLTAFAEAMDCDSTARDDALEAQRYILSARRNEGIAGALAGLTALFPLLVFVTLPFSIIAENRRQSGSALAVDAINRYNDAPACMGVAEATP